MIVSIAVITIVISIRIFRIASIRTTNILTTMFALIPIVSLLAFNCYLFDLSRLPATFFCCLVEEKVFDRPAANQQGHAALPD